MQKSDVQAGDLIGRHYRAFDIFRVILVCHIFSLLCWYYLELACL